MSFLRKDDTTYSCPFNRVRPLKIRNLRMGKEVREAASDLYR
jgi:hypothetical protein